MNSASAEIPNVAAPLLSSETRSAELTPGTAMLDCSRACSRLCWLVLPAGAAVALALTAICQLLQCVCCPVLQLVAEESHSD